MMASSDTHEDDQVRPVGDTWGCSPRSRGPAISQPPISRELDEKLLDEGQLRQHLSELASSTIGLTATLKPSPLAPAQSVPLFELIAPLVKREAFGGQVEYSSGGHRWLDTLIATQHGVRLVRLQLTV